MIFTIEYSRQCISNGHVRNDFALFIFWDFHHHVSRKWNFCRKWSAILLSVRIQLDWSAGIYQKVRHHSGRNDQVAATVGSFNLPDEFRKVFICKLCTIKLTNCYLIKTFCFSLIRSPMARTACLTFWKVSIKMAETGHSSLNIFYWYIARQKELYPLL